MTAIDQGVDTWVRTHAEAIRDAATRIGGIVRRTPLLPCDLADNVVLKPELLQVTGAFKARGATNAVLALRERDPECQGVVTVSSGNHAQAVAWAARRAGIHAVILIPQGANPIKVRATRDLGAEVISDGVTFENREDRVREVAAERGLPIVHPFDDWDVIHGQGTAALEVLEEVPAPGCIVTPLGGGGLLSGTSLIARALSPTTRLVGVEPEVAADAQESLRRREHVSLPSSPATLADGVKVLSMGERNYECIVERGLVDDIVTVSEAEIEAATRACWRTCRLAVEPTSALPLAALLAGRLPAPTPKHPLVCVLTGGNFDPAVVARLLAA